MKIIQFNIKYKYKENNMQKAKGNKECASRAS